MAVVGTGASAIQFVPEIQPDVEKLHVFQRTPPWIMPHPNRPMKPFERALYRRLPAAQRAMRAGIYWARESFVLQFRNSRMRKLATRMAVKQLADQVPDPALRERLTPRYEMGCKRILPTDAWYPAIQQPNVELLTEAIAEVRLGSIVGADGSEREVDTIIFGTGFHVTDIPIGDLVRGRDGRSLSENGTARHAPTRARPWRASPTCSSVGPNTGLGHNSIVFMIESQIAYR